MQCKFHGREKPVPFPAILKKVPRLELGKTYSILGIFISVNSLKIFTIV